MKKDKSDQWLDEEAHRSTQKNGLLSSENKEAKTTDNQ